MHMGLEMTIRDWTACKVLVYANCQERKINQYSYSTIKPTNHNNDQPGKMISQGCYSGIFILDVTNSCLIELKTDSIESSSCLVQYT